MDALDANDEESVKLKKLNEDVKNDSDNFELWEKLVQDGQSLEGGINRNSSPQAITATRDIYDRFLAKFPLFFGYWKKYADLEFSIAGTEAAEMIYERGIASISNSVDLWTNYCSFKVETSHDSDVIRDLRELKDWTLYLETDDGLFERGANSVGLDILAHPFWDKYLEFEERLDSYDKIFTILGRIIHVPMHQYARYFERYRQLAHSRQIADTVPAATLTQFRMDVEREGAGFNAGRTDVEVERDLRARIDAYHLEIFHHTQAETINRWPYESEIKRPYFHVTDLDDGQLANWRRYLDYEEAQGDFSRVQFLYERCLVTCAPYEEFWLRYARWMLAQPGKEEEIRNIYQRASCLYVPIAQPTIRLHYAFFEEMSGKVDVATDIHKAILEVLPGHVETIVSLANMSRRHGGLEAAIEVYKGQIDSPMCDISAKAALVAEWARLLWKIKGSPDDARQVFQKNQHWYLESGPFWSNYLRFELEQPTSAETEHSHYEQIKRVVEDVLTKSKLQDPIVKELVTMYMDYLLERGTKEVAREYLTLDREINGPASVSRGRMGKVGKDVAVANGQI